MTQRQRREDRGKRGREREIEGGREGGRKVGRDGGRKRVGEREGLSNNLMFKFHLIYIL